MSISLREENFVVIDIGSYISKGGVGTHDTNKPPTAFVNMSDFNNPIKDNNIASWEDLEASWQQILFKELGIKRARNEHPVLFTVPVHWNKIEYERLTQIAFENLNVPGLYIAPQPLLALYGCGSVSGLVVDIGHNSTDINVIVDSIVQQSSNIQIPIGGNHLDQYLLTLLKEDQDLVQQCKEANFEVDEAFARFIRETNKYHVAFGHSLQPTATSQVESDIGGAPAATMEEIADNDTSNEDEEEPVDIPEVEEIEYNGHKFKIGSYRHKIYDPLFNPILINMDVLSLSNAMLLAVDNCQPPEIRPKVWENVVLTGGCSQVKGLRRRVRAEVGRLLPISENSGDTQTRVIGFLRIPDYFTVLKDKNYQKYSTWLGGEIVAKLVFTDAKNYVSKVDYNESGPSVAHTKSY
ncbi:unnamed protein product [Cunninghamella blakesleeana]